MSYCKVDQISAEGLRTFSNPRGMTPITVTGMSWIAIWRPTIAGSPPKRRRHSASLMMHDEGGVGPIVGFLEVASERRRHAEHAKVIRAHVLAIESFWFSRRRSK